ERRIFGVMLESHLKPGRQDLIVGKELTYGQSITDPCIGWEDSEQLVHLLAEAVRKRRLALVDE
ncbi:MAG: 3-deoxy-7-phosphoheptulonate synthase, partial [Burkholderiales bacterium]|nr:3-deoxy-7-phosphoheptulonate synthase [Burkholderiales bacterium]